MNEQESKTYELLQTERDLLKAVVVAHEFYGPYTDPFSESQRKLDKARRDLFIFYDFYGIKLAGGK